MEIEKLFASKKARKKRLSSMVVLIIAIIAGLYVGENQLRNHPEETPATVGGTVIQATNEELQLKYPSALAALDAVPVKGRAPKTGYTRSQFGNGWLESGGCDTRNRILARDLAEVSYEVNSCIVLSGKLNDPYTGKVIPFLRGQGTSDDIQIDHVVALSDAWQKGAQQLTPALREQFANDGLNLLAVDGPANMNKGDGDAATWLPSNKAIRCGYVARQITVKLKYSLWVTAAEKSAIQKILSDCPAQPLAT
jgi:uncharacterized protein DUF1524